MTLNEASACLWALSNSNYTRKSSHSVNLQRLKLQTSAAIAFTQEVYFLKISFLVNIFASKKSWKYPFFRVLPFFILQN